MRSLLLSVLILVAGIVKADDYRPPVRLPIDHNLPLVSATPVAGYLHVSIDVCPDWIEYAVADLPNSPEVHYQSDDFWIAFSDVWMFHGSGTGSLHHFDLTASVVTLSPDPSDESNPNYRGYDYHTYHGTSVVEEYRLLPVVSASSQAIPEPSFHSSSAARILCSVAALVYVARRRRSR